MQPFCLACLLGRHGGSFERLAQCAETPILQPGPQQRALLLLPELNHLSDLACSAVPTPWPAEEAWDQSDWYPMPGRPLESAPAKTALQQSADGWKWQGTRLLKRPLGFETSRGTSHDFPRRWWGARRSEGALSRRASACSRRWSLGLSSSHRRGGVSGPPFEQHSALSATRSTLPLEAQLRGEHRSG